MSGFNLPPGVGVNDIPGNTREDAAWDKLFERVGDDSTLLGWSAEDAAAAWRVGATALRLAQTRGVSSPREEELLSSPAPNEEMKPCEGMEVKLLYVVDEATEMHALAVRLLPRHERERKILSKRGFGTSPTLQGSYILVSFLDNTVATTDPFGHTSIGGTRSAAHRLIIRNWRHLSSGDVVDARDIDNK